MRAEDLFIFVGAGASWSPPASRPVFGEIRRAVVDQLHLGAYLVERHGRGTAPVDSVYPEPFMLELARARADVPAWLSDVLDGGRPNAAHTALAELALRGARVWTVNFDKLIERAAGGTLPVLAWPAEPAPTAGTELLKPHGSLGGKLIVTSEQVLTGLSPAWESRLRADMHGRVVALLGYSAHDLDFQPLWLELLANAPAVHWFDMPTDPDRAHKEWLLGDALATGRASFPPPASVPPGVRPNPSLDFVEWCRSQGLVHVDPALTAALLGARPDPMFPVLPQAGALAAGGVQGMLGDIRRARRSYLRAILTRRPVTAARRLVALQANHGGRPTAAVMRLGSLLPPLGKLDAARIAINRKRLTIMANMGRHQEILRATEHLPHDARSTLLILRSASLRIAGSLDDAAATAAVAYQRAAEQEHHPVLTPTPRSNGRWP